MASMVYGVARLSSCLARELFRFVSACSGFARLLHGSVL